MASGLFGTNTQVGDIRQTALQPAGLPGSTFVRPQERETGGNLHALANALGNLNGALLDYGHVLAAEKNDPKSNENREQVARLQQMSREQLVSEIAGHTLDGNKVQLDAAELLLGERANDDFRKQWLEFYNTKFDRSSGDAAAEYERQRKAFADALPSEISKGHFYSLTGDHFRAWMEKDTEDKVALAKQEVNSTIVSSFRNAVDDAMNVNGKTAEEAAQIVFAKSAANRDFLALSGQEQNETVFSIAEEFALQGREDIAKALLEGQRVGSDGRVLPSLRNTAGYTDKAIQLLERAGTLHDEKIKEQGYSTFREVDDLVLRGAFNEKEAEKYRGKGVFTDKELANKVDESTHNLLTIQNKAATEAQKRALRAESERQEQGVYSAAYGAMGRMGGINRLRDVEVPNESGEGTRTVTRQQQIDAVVDRREGEFEDYQEQLIAAGQSPEEARARTNRMRVDWYAGNGIPNKDWQNTLNGIAGRATTDTLLQKGEVSDYLKQSASLYRQLKQTNPAYLSTLLTDKASKEFLDAYDMGVTQRRMTDADALQYAATWTAQPESVKARQMMDKTDAERLASKTLRNMGLDDRTQNFGWAMSRIESMSLNGATEGEIKERLETELSDTAVPINGVLVFANNDLPADFPELMEDELAKRAPALKERYGIDKDDLYIVADGAGSKWTVWSKSLRQPVAVPGDGPITPQTLEDHRQARQAAHDETIRKLAAAKEEERADAKKQYDEDIANERARIAYWRDKESKRKGVAKGIAGYVADQLEDDLNKRLTKDDAQLKKALEDVKAKLKQGDEQSRKELEWLRSLVPTVRINGKVVLE